MITLAYMVCTCSIGSWGTLACVVMCCWGPVALAVGLVETTCRCGVLFVWLAGASVMVWTRCLLLCVCAESCVLCMYAL